MTRPPIKAPFELPQTEAGIEVVARWIEEGGPGVNLESTRKLMAATVRSLSHPAAQAGAVQAVPEGDWLWCKLMDFCKKRGFAPASFDDLFTIVGEARALAATQPSAAPGDGQGAEVLCPNGERWDDNPDGIQPGQESGARMNRETGFYEGGEADEESVTADEAIAAGHTPGDSVPGVSTRELVRAMNRRAAPGAAIAAREQEDTKRLDALVRESWDLRCFDHSDGESVGWRVVSHYMAKPHERIVAEVFTDDPREAIDAALASPAAVPTSQPNAAAQEQQAGWRWVPVEPTPAMVEAGANADPERESVWAAYLAAAPTPTGMGSMGLPSGRGEEQS